MFPRPHPVAAIVAGLCTLGSAASQAATQSQALFQYDSQTLAQQVGQNVAIVTAESSPGGFPGPFAGFGNAARAEGRALAAAQTATLRARAEVASRNDLPSGTFGGDIHTARADAAFTHDMVIGPGTSGLGFGTSITVNVTLQLDGRVRNGHPISYGTPMAITDPYYVLSSADTEARFSIFDPNLQGVVCGETCVPVTGITLAQFDYGGSDRFSQMYLTPWDVGAPGQLSTDSRDAWSYSVYQGASGRFERPTEHHEGDIWAPQQMLTEFDTGSFSFQYKTSVGATNRLSGWMSIFLQAMGVRATGFTEANFGNTFDVEFNAVGVNGIEFTGITSGVTQFDGSITPVPEPHTAALLLAGLGVVALRLRRRAA